MSPRTVEQNLKIRKERRASILNAAFVVFAQNGFTSSTISQIAKQASVSKGLVYNYFESKEDLLLAMFENLAEGAEHLWPEDYSISAQERFKQLLDSTFSFYENNQELGRLMTQLALQKDVLESLKVQIEKLLRDKMASVETLFKELQYNDPKLEAFYLGALLDGLGFGSLVFQENYPLREMKNLIYKRYNLI